MDELIKAFLKFGLVPTVLLVILILIVQDSSRAYALKKLVTKPFFRAFRWFSKTYVSSEISGTINSYFKNSIYNLMVHDPNTEVKIKWVSKTKDPYFKKDGSLILRIKEDDDQTKNILSAAQIAIPQIVCPLTRLHVDNHVFAAIDLTIMQNIADKIGRHGKFVFRKYFLEPETKNESRIGELIAKLIILDKHGLFTPILINELELVGEGLYAESDTKDYTSETIKFIEYLLTIVNRERRANIELNYVEGPFKVGTILLAKTERATTQGLRPYLRRLRIKIENGCETIYLISYPNSFNFYQRLIRTVDSHEQIIVAKLIDTIDFQNNGKDRSENFKIAVLSTNQVKASTSFKERVSVNGIELGNIYLGSVDDVSNNEALINILGMRAYISKEDCSWGYCNNCNDELEVDKEYEFLVKEIDYVTSTIHLSRRIESENPWNSQSKPNIGDKISITISGVKNGELYGFYNLLPVKIPKGGISWFGLTVDELTDFIDRQIEMQVDGVDEVNHEIIGNLKTLVEDPWPKIHELLPKGEEFNAKVIEVNEHFVRVEVDHAISGIIPKESLVKAGHEYVDYVNNIKVGQGLNVYISKVFIKKKLIRFDLTRNK